MRGMFLILGFFFCALNLKASALNNVAPAEGASYIEHICFNIVDGQCIDNKDNKDSTETIKQDGINHRSWFKTLKNSLFRSDLTFGIDAPYFLDRDNILLSPGYGFAKYSTGFSRYRIDTFNLDMSYAPGDFIGGLPIHFSLAAGTSISVIQKYQNRSDVLKLKPFNLFRIPFNAERTKKYLTKGNIVTFNAYLNLAVGPQAVWALVPSPLYAHVGGYYILSGFFKLEIKKLNDNRARIRLSTTKANGVLASGGFGISYYLSSNRIVNGLINNNLVFLNLLGVSASLKKQNYKLLDYIFNLNDPDATKAFNQIIASGYKIKSSVHISGKDPNNNLDHRILSWTLLADELHQKDKDKEISQRRVMRLFSGDIYSKITGRDYEVGLIFGKIEGGQKFSQQEITLFDQPTNRYFYSPSFFKLQRKKFSLGILAGAKVFNFASLFEKDKNGNIIDFNGISFLYMKRSHTFTKNKINQLRNHFVRNIPESILANMPWGGGVRLAPTGRTSGPENGLIISMALLKKCIFVFLKDYSIAELYSRFDKYYNHLRRRRALPKDRLYHLPFIYRKERKQIVNAIHNLFSNENWTLLKKMSDKSYPKTENEHKIMSLTLKKSVDQFMKLRNSKLFYDLGLGFISHLASGHKWEDVLHFFLAMGGTNVTPFRFIMGAGAEAKLYKTFFNINLQMVNLPDDYENS